jgi:hypothetical protein
MSSRGAWRKRRIDQIGTETTCKMPPRAQKDSFAASAAALTPESDWRHRAGILRRDLGQGLSAPTGDEQEVSVELTLIVFGDRLYRLRIVGVDGRLQARQVCRQPGFAREVLDEDPPVLFDEGTGLIQPSPQFLLRRSVTATFTL